MSGINDRVRNYLNNIRNDIEVERTLGDLKLALSACTKNQRIAVGSDCQLSILFDCLNSSNKEQISLTCDVLKIILPVLPVDLLITQHGTALIRALGHPTTDVKVVILDEFIRAVGNDNLMSVVEQDTTLLTSVGRCLCHENISVGKRAVNFFIKFGQTKSGLVSLCQPAVIKELMENIGNNNVFVLRIFEVLVEVSASSGDALEYLEMEGLLDRLSTFLRTDDILAMLALVEVCTKMAVTPHGWDFFSRHGIVKNLVEQLVSYEDNPLSSLTFPGLSKFFGHIGQVNPSIFVKSYPEVLKCAFKAVDSSDLNIFIPALEIIGRIAYTPQGKFVLQKQDERLMRHVMGKLYEAMTKLPSEWRVRALHTVANIIHVEDKHRTAEVLRLTETWFNQLGMYGLSSIQEMTQQPFYDVKAAAYSILLNLANQRWGVVKIYETNNLLVYLLNRRTEHDAEGLQLKYDVIKVMVESKSCEATFPRLEYEALVEYVRQGAFYSPRVNEVAIEGGD